MALPPKTLTPINPENQDGLLDTFSTNGVLSFLDYDVDQWDYFQVQLVQVTGSGWTSTTVVTIKWSHDGSNFINLSTSVTFGDTTTAKDRFRVSGMKRVRVCVTTASGSAGDAIHKVLVRAHQAEGR